MAFIDIPERREFTASLAGGPLVRPTAMVRAYEITQTVQNLAHEVRLLAGKPTVVRVYLEARNLPADVVVRGELVISAAPGAPGTYVASADTVLLSDAVGPDLAEQRRDAALSLNFRISAPPVGPMTVRLKRLASVADGAELPLAPAAGAGITRVDFVEGPTLRIRTLGLRYVDPRPNPPVTFAPAATHFDHLRSYLRRTYPVSGLDWNQAVIDASADFAPPFSGQPLPNGSDPLWGALLSVLHRQMMLVRQADMDAGWDPRTHYYGLVSDHSGFFRGAANDVPTTPAPNTVAVGPCGQPGPGYWDDDGSYGDWYGAHELAHTFGRFHPGFCEQSADDDDFPHAGGALSDEGQDCIGFDVGDAELNLPMRAYPHEAWTDFMTYCDRQWVSKYTYDGLFDRLVREDIEFAP